MPNCCARSSRSRTRSSTRAAPRSASTTRTPTSSSSQPSRTPTSSRCSACACPRRRASPDGSLTSQTPLVIDELQNDPRFAVDVAEQTGYVPKGLMAVPLLHDERALGRAPGARPAEQIALLARGDGTAGDVRDAGGGCARPALLGPAGPRRPGRQGRPGRGGPGRRPRSTGSRKTSARRGSRSCASSSGSSPSVGPLSARARIWFGLRVIGQPTRQAPPNQVRFGVPAAQRQDPNLIRATEESRLIAQDDLREPDSSVSGRSPQTHEPGSPYSGEPGSTTKARLPGPSENRLSSRS